MGSLRSLMKDIPVIGSRIDWMALKKRRIYRRYLLLRASSDGVVSFRCNICGCPTSFPRQHLSREDCSCVNCGSSVRWRSVIHALSLELFGKSLTLPEFPFRPDIAGIGMSDWEGYADHLKRKLSYTNTFYHAEPFLDIMNVDPSQFGLYDFVISSDVFEHIPPPSIEAFKNTLRLLKPGGVFIFTAPYVSGETKEHFPSLNKFSIENRAGSWILLNRAADGRLETFENLTFHGGPGTTVEMRIFGDRSLIHEVEAAGFRNRKVHSDEYHQFGIVWIPYDATKARYRPYIDGLDTPPWALRKE